MCFQSISYQAGSLKSFIMQKMYVPERSIMTVNGPYLMQQNLLNVNDYTRL